MKIEKLSANGFRITDVFDSELLAEICNLCDTMIATSTHTNGIAIREKINLSGTELKNKVAAALCSIFTADIAGIELYRDYPGYTNAYHMDDPFTQNIIIVYLGDEDLAIGTGYIEQEHYTVPYKKNTAIMLSNSNKIMHGLIGQVPNNVIRKILYINWRNNE